MDSGVLYKRKHHTPPLPLREQQACFWSHYNQWATLLNLRLPFAVASNFLPLIAEVLFSEMLKRRQKVYLIICLAFQDQVKLDLCFELCFYSEVAVILSGKAKSILKSWPKCFLHPDFNVQELGGSNNTNSRFYQFRFQLLQ